MAQGSQGVGRGQRRQPVPRLPRTGGLARRHPAPAPPADVQSDRPLRDRCGCAPTRPPRRGPAGRPPPARSGSARRPPPSAAPGWGAACAPSPACPCPSAAPPAAAAGPAAPAARAPLGPAQAPLRPSLRRSVMASAGAGRGRGDTPEGGDAGPGARRHAGRWRRHGGWGAETRRRGRRGAGAPGARRRGDAGVGGVATRRSRGYTGAGAGGHFGAGDTGRQGAAETPGDGDRGAGTSEEGTRGPGTGDLRGRQGLGARGRQVELGRGCSGTPNVERARGFGMAGG